MKCAIFGFLSLAVVMIDSNRLPEKEVSVPLSDRWINEGGFKDDYVDESRVGTVLCPKYDYGLKYEDSNYCDCSGDCIDNPEWCSCTEAKQCCKWQDY